MSTQLSGLVHALKAKRVGSTWMACCPAHDDRDPSLSICENDGKVLLHCHAGCEQRAVIDALKARGLWESSRTEQRHIVATYDYADEHGELLYQVVRFEPKDFRQRRPDGRGGWIWKKNPQQVLYRLSEVLEARIVFIVEGEKDVETLRTHGFVATTNAGGAPAPWLPEYSQVLRGREVILVPDNDAAGRQRVLKIARALIRKPAKLVILELEGAKDVSEWFAQGHSEIEFIRLAEGEEVAQ